MIPYGFQRAQEVAPYVSQKTIPGASPELEPRRIDRASCTLSVCLGPSFWDAPGIVFRHVRGSSARKLSNTARPHVCTELEIVEPPIFSRKYMSRLAAPSILSLIRFLPSSIRVLYLELHGNSILFSNVVKKPDVSKVRSEPI